MEYVILLLKRMTCVFTLTPVGNDQGQLGVYVHFYLTSSCQFEESHIFHLRQYNKSQEYRTILKLSLIRGDLKWRGALFPHPSPLLPGAPLRHGGGERLLPALRRALPGVQVRPAARALLRGRRRLLRVQGQHVRHQVLPAHQLGIRPPGKKMD